MWNFRPGVRGGRIVMYGDSPLAEACVAEALARSCEVTCVVDEPAAEVPAGVSAHVGDPSDADDVARLASEHDVVVFALTPGDGGEATYVTTLGVVAENVGTRRLVVLGNAGVLEVAPGLRMAETGSFPREAVPSARAAAAGLAHLRSTGTLLDWLFVAPAAYLTDGPRTGEYRLGGTTLIGDRLSIADLAVAVHDEIESAERHREVVSVAY